MSNEILCCDPRDLASGSHAEEYHRARMSVDLFEDAQRDPTRRFHDVTCSDPRWI
jgi:hypothetical protein